MTECWLPIQGLEGLYEISDHGRIRSLDRFQLQRGNRHAREVKGCLLKIQVQRRGRYCAVSLWHPSGIRTTTRIHTLVCTHFVGPKPSEKYEVNHKDGDKQNNHRSNLEWVVRQRNIQHAMDTNLNPIKTRPEVIADIQAMLAKIHPTKGRLIEAYKLIARRYRIHLDTVRRIDRGLLQ